MTKTQEFMPSATSPADYPGMGLLDITGPQTVFWSAAQFLEARGAPSYVRRTVSISGGVVVTTEGIGIDTHRSATSKGWRSTLSSSQAPTR
jgi:hypothetical protein